MKPQGSDARPQPTSHSDGKGGAYVVLDTPVVDEKGKVIGTEPRRYALLKSGRNLVVEEEGPPPTQQDKDDLHKFLHMAKVSYPFFFLFLRCPHRCTEKRCQIKPLDAALMLAPKTAEEMARLRHQYRLEAADGVALIDTVKAALPTALGNWTASILYPVPEFCADEIHLATMGLSDNFGAISDVVAMHRSLLNQVRHFYGVKFGDGRYEASDKSKDGQGDVHKLSRDVKFATSGKLQQLLMARIASDRAEVSEEEVSVVQVLETGEWEAVVRLYANASDEQLEKIRAAHSDLPALCKRLAGEGGDAEVERALFARLADHNTFWAGRLRASVSPSLNRKLLVRVVACNSPQQRAALLAEVPEARQML